MWIIPKNLPCFPSAPVERVLTSASDWPFPLLARFAGLSGKPSRSRSWFAAWKRANWMQRLVSRTCEDSTAKSGVASWIASLQVSRVSRIPSLASGVDRTMAELPQQFAKRRATGFAQASCFSRTCQDFSLWKEESSLGRSSQTLSDWVSKLRRTASRRRKLALRTRGSVYSSSASEWMTPTVPNGGRIGTRNEEGREGQERYIENQASKWPTPKAGQQGADPEGCEGHTGGPNLKRIAEMWTTPQAHDVGERGSGQQPTSAAGNACLARDARLWPTARGCLSRSDDCRNSPSLPLTGAASQWKTPHGMGGIDSTGKLGSGGEFAKQRIEACRCREHRNYGRRR